MEIKSTIFIFAIAKRLRSLSFNQWINGARHAIGISRMFPLLLKRPLQVSTLSDLTGNLSRFLPTFSSTEPREQRNQFRI